MYCTCGSEMYMYGRQGSRLTSTAGKPILCSTRHGYQNIKRMNEFCLFPIKFECIPQLYLTLTPMLLLCFFFLLFWTDLPQLKLIMPIWGMTYVRTNYSNVDLCKTQLTFIHCDCIPTVFDDKTNERICVSFYK